MNPVRNLRQFDSGNLIHNLIAKLLEQNIVCKILYGMKTKPSITSLMIACALLFLCVPFSGYAQKNEGIHFETDSLPVLELQAKKEGKLIFIDAYFTGCEPCAWMADSVFTDSAVAHFYNSNFINGQINMGKGERRDLAKKYHVNCFPTYLFIDGDGNVVHRMSSTCPAEQFVEIGKDALNPEKQFCALQKKYDGGTSTSSEFISYMILREATCLGLDSTMVKRMAEYDSTQAEANLTDRQNWAVLYSPVISDPHSRMFQYFLLHRDIYKTKYTADSVNQTLNRVYGTAMSNCLYQKVPADTDGYKNLRAEIIALNEPALNQLVSGENIEFYRVTKDWDNYRDTMMMYVEKYAAKDDWLIFNESAWGFCENLSDTASLDTAIAWIKRSVEINSNYWNTDTYAALLYKRGDYHEALVWVKIALVRAKEEKETDTQSTKDMLALIKAARKKK